LGARLPVKIWKNLSEKNAKMDQKATNPAKIRFPVAAKM
jgi:hypothetical protein